MPKKSHSALRRNFRELFATPTCVETASVFDPMSARIAADLGFEVGILGGSVASLQVLAAPDFALITLSEFVEQATRIGRVAQLPFIADADHGYGNALNVMRTVQGSPPVENWTMKRWSASLPTTALVPAAGQPQVTAPVVLEMLQAGAPTAA